MYHIVVAYHMTSYSDMSYLSYCLSVSFCISSFAKKVIFGFFLFYGFFSKKKVIFGFLKSEKKTLLYTLLGAHAKSGFRMNGGTRVGSNTEVVYEVSDTHCGKLFLCSSIMVGCVFPLVYKHFDFIDQNHIYDRKSKMFHSTPEISGTDRLTKDYGV
jgi:hypothetical protein